MLRVAHVLNSPGRGGVPRVVHALIRHCDPNQISPHLFYLKNGNGSDLFVDMDIPHRIAKSASKATAMMELVGFLDKHRIDILHTHSYRPNLYARMAGSVLRPTGLNIIAHYHNEYSDKWSNQALVLERQLAGVTDVGLAVSGAVAANVAEQVGLDCDVLENGIDRHRVTSGCRTRGRIALGLDLKTTAVGLIGRICRQKGVDTFIEAALLLSHQMLEAHFVVVGDAEDASLAETLRDRVNASGLEHRVHFAGHREDMADVLAALDILVAPSRWEGFGLVLAEAMAAGIPVVASKVGGIPGVVGQAACLIPPQDPQALAQSLMKIARDEILQSRMRKEGIQEAARFDWTVSAKKLTTHYLRVGKRP